MQERLEKNPVPDKNLTGQPESKKPKNVAERTKAVEDIVRFRPFSKGAQNLSAIGFCGSSSPYCKEWLTAYQPEKWNQNNSTGQLTFNTNLMIGMYSAGSNKYILVRSIGSIGTSMQWNGSWDRGYFIENFKAEMYPTTSGLTRRDTSPINANNTSSLRSTTSFGFKTTSGVPEVSGSYSQSITQQLSDWGVTNHSVSDAIKGKWEFYLAKVGGSSYDSWKSAIEYKNIKSFPTMSSTGFQPKAEAYWSAASTDTTNHTFYTKWDVMTRNTWLRGFCYTVWFVPVCYYEPHTSRYFRTRGPVWYAVNLGSIAAAP